MYSQRSRSKSIKKITILDGKKPPLSHRSKLQNKQNNTFRGNQVKKKPLKHDVNSDIINKNRQKQIQELVRMIEQMKIKQIKQLKIIRQQKAKNEEYRQLYERNKELKTQLQQLKQLMKCVLLEREQERMFTFYKND